VALDHRMNGKLDGPGEPEPPDRANTPPDARALIRCS
jgi:hypothetical protein